VPAPSATSPLLSGGRFFWVKAAAHNPAMVSIMLDLLCRHKACNKALSSVMAATGPLLFGGQLSAEQLAAFRVQYRALQAWVRRQCVEKAGAAVDVLLRVLGV
jgi:hypothetical protein